MARSVQSSIVTIRFEERVREGRGTAFPRIGRERRSPVGGRDGVLSGRASRAGA